MRVEGSARRRMGRDEWVQTIVKKRIPWPSPRTRLAGGAWSGVGVGHAARCQGTVEPPPGLEPGTPSLPWKCSTAELRRRYGRESGRRDSNPRPSAWKADALPTELLPRGGSPKRTVLWAGKDSNLRTRMRTDLQSVAFNHSATCPGVSTRQESASLRSLSRRRPEELAKGLEPPTC